MERWYKRLPRAAFQPLIDNVCHRLAPAMASFYTSAGRLVLVKFVVTSIPIYLTIAMKLPEWLLQFFEKRICAFFWKGFEAVSGGNCLVDLSYHCHEVAGVAPAILR